MRFESAFKGVLCFHEMFALLSIIIRMAQWNEFNFLAIYHPESRHPANAMQA